MQLFESGRWIKTDLPKIHIGNLIQTIFHLGRRKVGAGLDGSGDFRAYFAVQPVRGGDEERQQQHWNQQAFDQGQQQVFTDIDRRLALEHKFCAMGWVDRCFCAWAKTVYSECP